MPNVKQEMSQIPSDKTDDADWLVIVACTVDNKELKSEALQRLSELNFTPEQIINRYKELDSEEKQKEAFEKVWKKQVEENKTQEYSFNDKLKIFFWGPYKLFKQYNSGLVYLHEGNYQIKFRQRLFLLIAGTLFWILLFYGAFEYYEHKRLRQIEQGEQK